MKFVFAKLHCEQSDYLIANASVPENTADFCAKVANRRIGAGADGVVFVQQEGGQCIAHQFNPDGSKANLCDSALRCVAKFLSQKAEKVNDFTINNVVVKILSPSLIETSIENISLNPLDIPLLQINKNDVNGLCEIYGEGVRLTAIQCGIPYAVVFCDNITHVDVENKGRLFQNSRTFKNGINVAFIQIVDNSCLRLRVYRSGCGEVPSCANGAVAAAYVANSLQLCATEINAVFGNGAMKIKLKDNCATISATAYFVGSFEIKE